MLEQLIHVVCVISSCVFLIAAAAALFDISRKKRKQYLDGLHWNRIDATCPVDLEFYIRVDDYTELKVMRCFYLVNSGEDIYYAALPLDQKGEPIYSFTGRFPWRYA